MTLPVVEEILRAYDLPHELRLVEPLAGGHIHRSYKIMKGVRYFFLQEINREVFPDVAAMMGNIRRVTDFLQAKYLERFDVETLNLYRTKTGTDFHAHSDGSCWRLYDFKSHLRTYEEPPIDPLITRAARAFGEFAADLADFPFEQLAVTLPRFHDVTFRYEQFADALARNAARRADDCRAEIEYVEAFWEDFTTIDRLIAAGELPVRVVHNDAKLSNVMIQPAGRRRCVVDLDTVMPGCLLHDYGDGIRSILGPEDQLPDTSNEAEMQRITARINAFSKGYLEATHGILTATERHHLPTAIPLLPFLMGVRFLTDFLNGDVYYRTEYPTHNLARARAQLGWAHHFSNFMNAS